jgi:MerR family transcriptional regulator, light-induced transcriptional regulator
MTALAAAARRTRAAAVLVWLSRLDDAALPGLADVTAAHRGVQVLVGGPGWQGVDVGPATALHHLPGAVAALERAWRGGRPGHRQSSPPPEVAQLR